MGASVESIDGDISLKFNKFLVEEGQNEISDSHKFIYSFSDTVGEEHGSNRVKSVIDLITGQVPAPPETGNDIILDSDILLDIDGKIWMQYVVSDLDPYDGYGTQGTMAVTLTASDTAGFVALGLPDDSDGMV